MTKVDIENIKELIQGAKEYGQFEGNKYFKSIENILTERKQDKEKIKELEAKLEFKQYGDLDNLKFEEYMNEFISKEKIRDKIKELKIIQEENADEIKRNVRFYSIYDSYELQINELQELLQEEDK